MIFVSQHLLNESCNYRQCKTQPHNLYSTHNIVTRRSNSSSLKRTYSILQQNSISGKLFIVERQLCRHSITVLQLTHTRNLWIFYLGNLGNGRQFYRLDLLQVDVIATSLS